MIAIFPSEFIRVHLRFHSCPPSSGCSLGVFMFKCRISRFRPFAFSRSQTVGELTGRQIMDYEPLPQRILMGPGPSNVNARVLQALAMPTIGHLDPAFTQLMDETMERLRGLFGTRNSLSFPVSGTGSAGMEACFVNVLQPGDRVS